MIVINARFLEQKISGVQRYAIEVCKKLPTEIAGHKIVYVSSKLTLDNELTNNIEIVSFGRFKGQLWEQIDLPIFLKKKGNPLLINFVGVGPLFYKNKVTFLYDLSFKHHPEWFSYKFQKTYNFLVPISINNSRLIITDSNYVKQDIMGTYAIDTQKIEVIYAAPSKKFINKGLEKEKIILIVSSIDPRKNLIRSIEAFNLIDSEHKLVIVGSKHRTFSKISLGDNLVNENITFTGYLEDEELVDLYNKAEIFIYPSLFEGFGIPPLEAQACGCPCLVSNSTSLPEVYEDSVYYCDPKSTESIKDGILFLIKNKEKREELKNKGLKNVRRYGWENSTKKLIEIVEKLLA